MATLNYSQELYTYLKDKYGVLDTEKFIPDEDISKEIIIQIPEFIKNSEKHSICVFIEAKDTRLIISECDISDVHSFSRIIEIKNNNDLQGAAWLNIVQNIILGRGYNHENILLLINIVNEFDSLYKERTKT